MTSRRYLDSPGYKPKASLRRTVGASVLGVHLRGDEFTCKLEIGLAIVTKLPCYKNTVVYMGEDNKDRLERNIHKKKLDNHLKSSSEITVVRPLIW